MEYKVHGNCLYKFFFLISKQRTELTKDHGQCVQTCWKIGLGQIGEQGNQNLLLNITTWYITELLFLELYLFKMHNLL